MALPLPSKQVLISFAAAFGLSLGAGTGVVMVRTPKAAPARPTVPVKHDSSRVARVAPKDTVPAPDSVAPGHAPMELPHDSAASSAHLAVAGPKPVSPAAPGAEPSKAVVTKGAATSAPATAPSGTDKAGHAVIPGAAPKPTPAVRPMPTPARDTLVGQRLAKVFGAMQARDAARVLEQMDDSDVRTILGLLSSKQQAAILGTFPAQRAATLMRATLRTNPGADQ